MNNKVSIYQNLLELTIANPGHPALFYEKKTISRASLLQKVNRLAHYFTEHQIGKGDVVMIIGPNTPEIVAAFFACSQKNIITFLLTPLAKEENIIQEYKKKNCKMLIIISALMNNYPHLLKENFNFLVIDPSESLSVLKRWAYAQLNKKDLKLYNSCKKSVDVYHRIKGGDRDYRSYDVNEGRIYLSSGGTSGDPKTIVLSDFAVLSLVKSVPFVLGDKLLSQIDEKYMLAALPIFHGFGLVMGVLTLLLFGGCDSLVPKFRSQKVIDLIAENKCHIIIGVPAMFEALLNNKNFDGPLLKNIDICFIGGDFIPPSLLTRFNERLKSNGSSGRIFEGYGLTETVTVLAVNTMKDQRVSSVGKPLSNIKVKILDENHTEVKPLVKGEIAIAGETLMNGYLEDESPFIRLGREKYVLSGDIGYMDSDGYLFFSSRRKRIIKRKGYNIFPLEIEKYISSLPMVANCSYQSKNGEKQEDTFLFVKLHEGHREEDAEKEIKASIRRHGHDYEIPDNIVFVDVFPMTPVGKVDYVKLFKSIGE